MRKVFLFFFFVFFFISFCSAEHFILGQVGDALNGESAEGHVVVLWNSENGISDNLTDVIDFNNNFSFDCEDLSGGCKVNDELHLKVSNQGDNYVSEEVTVVVSGGGEDLVESFRLNSPPSVNLGYPQDNANVSSVVLNCSVNDLDGDLDRVELFGNWSGTWMLNETVFVSGGLDVVSFSKNLDEGFYDWNCVVYDSLNISDVYEENYSFGVDYTRPVINSVFVNESYVCGSANVRVSCNSSDNFGISNVIIEAVNSTSAKNYSALFDGIYYYDFFVDDFFEWEFNCYVYDDADNVESDSVFMNVFSFLPDFRVDSSLINFSNYFPIEGEEIEISVPVENVGCSDAESVLIGFYEDGLSGINFENYSTSISGLSNVSVNVMWSSVVGKSDIFVFADLNNSFVEDNEGNNIGSALFEVSSWQDFYGDISSIKLLSDFFVNDMLSWNTSGVSGNVFIADSESDIDWFSLVGIGRNLSGEVFVDDFGEMDSSLKMEEFDDSVENVFSDFGVPKYLENFSIHGSEVLNVPIINTSDGFEFVTGILWDSSDDTNGEYDLSDKEDLVFVSSINEGSVGAYGVYDFEIKIPALLRSYDSMDSGEVYFYYEIK
ncbi:MAG: hypothetical protein OQK82_03055 [Candidatus Pacearchaeota archaeon]|nr:hypothetical protein [Candidatus Pacearchaeota archaeon]